MTQKKGAPMQLCICVAVVAAAVSLLSNVGPPRARRPLLADLQLQEAGDVVLVPANWAHAILNEAPVVGAAFEHLDAYLIASNSRRVFA